MKIYVLTCIDENNQLAFCKTYVNPDDAKIEMIKQAVRKREMFRKLNRKGQYLEVGDTEIVTGDTEQCCIWNITENELNPHAEHAPASLSASPG